MLLEHGADVNSQGPRYANSSAEPCLLVAASTGAFRMVELLLSFGADPNLCNYHGTTALTTSAEAGHLEIVKLLIAHGVSFADDVHDNDRDTVLHCAVVGGRHNVVEWLLLNGATSQARNKYGLTALEYAVDSLKAVEEGKLRQVSWFHVLENADNDSTLRLHNYRETVGLLQAAERDTPANDFERLSLQD